MDGDEMRAWGNLLIAGATIASVHLAASAQTVTAPPRPPGFTMVRPMAGMQPPEAKRYIGTEAHRYQHPDAIRDDTLQPTAAAPGRDARGPASTTAQSAPADLGGSGTGPKRELTDKGASSYFYDHGKEGRGKRPTPPSRPSP
jgi:hypothetical protein